MTETGPGTRDLRCVAVLAVAVRREREATQDLLEVLKSKDRATRENAVIALAYAGDASGWHLVFDWLKTELDRKTRTASWPPLTAVGIAYLARHLGSSTDRKVQLVQAVRARWFALDRDERAWLEEYWPEVQPGGAETAEVAVPDPVQLQSWVEGLPLFSES